MAHLVASRSKDPSTQVGTVLVMNNQLVSSGYNGMPAGAPETPEVWERPLKYDLVLHSEINAVGQAAQKGAVCWGATAYVTHFPCLGCAKALVAAGVQEVVYSGLVKGWDDEHKKSLKLLEYAGIIVRLAQ